MRRLNQLDAVDLNYMRVQSRLLWIQLNFRLSAAFDLNAAFHMCRIKFIKYVILVIINHQKKGHRIFT